MKTLIYAATLAASLSFTGCTNQPKEEPIASVIDRGLERATEHALRMAKELENQEGRLPKSILDGQLETSDYSWWCSGFFPGELWYLYENNPTDELKKYAEMYTVRVEDVKNITYSHDVGFMLNCNFALMHSTGNFPGNGEVDVPLSYADYYYVEALLRLKKAIQFRAAWRPISILKCPTAKPSAILWENPQKRVISG